MLSTTARTLTYAVAVLYAILGIVLFIVPGWATANFLWQVTPFIVMTMGAWYLGGAFVAWQSARIWHWPAIYPSLIFLGWFSILEMGVLLQHYQVLRLEAILAWPYILILAIGIIASVKGLLDWIQKRPATTTEGATVPGWVRLMVVGFVLFASFISLPLLSGAARGGTIWPSEFTLLTARAFGAFYFSLVLAVLPLIWARRMLPIVTLLPAAVVGSVIITIPALVFINLFNFADKPGGLLYIGTYILVFVGAIAILLLHRKRYNTEASEKTRISAS